MIKLKNLLWQPLPVEAQDVDKDNLHFGPREQKTVANRYADARDVKNQINAGNLRMKELSRESSSSDDDE